MKKLIKTDKAPAAIGPYNQATAIDGLVFTSGQIPLDPATGKLVSGGITEQTEMVMANLVAVLAAAGCTPAHVVKTTCFLNDMNNFGAFNEVYARTFSDNPPARSCVAVKTLPMDVLVEVEAIASK
ncbi:regulator [bacterium DOLJORAL78_65_58]|nr:MAG: regulator [bacterium DOLZORAL124_64_63]PIE75551.1 MAG: regulator [bacterium DOLJORAL78_65_58]